VAHKPGNIAMDLTKYRHPILFYFLATAIPWLFWGIAAYLSHNYDAPNRALEGAFGLLGLISPAVVAFTMMVISPSLRKDIIGRVFTFTKSRPIYWLAAFGLMPASILLAQGISLLFGHSPNQFHLASSTSFSYGLFPAWFLLLLAPLLEELAWHSYGTDCLRARFSLFTTSIIFGLFWVIWHMPLGFIKDYYHSNLADSGWIYTLNFALSLFPFVILMNWLYYKTNRNITIAIIFHITAGVFNEIFTTHPDSKVIQTGLLLLLSIYLLCKEPQFFFAPYKSQRNT
jgi:uncharacterized protein